MVAERLDDRVGSGPIRGATYGGLRALRRACNHQRMQIVLLTSLVGSALLFIVAGVAMLVLRFRGQPIPTWLIRLAVAVLALQSGSGGIFFIRTPVMLVSIVAQTAVIAWFLWRGGRRTTTGVLLIGTGLLGALWWGYYLLEDLIDPLSLYETVLWLWWAPSVLLVIAGAAMLPLGDRKVEKPIFPVAPSLKRDPMPIATAIARESSIGPLPLPTLVADGAALIAAAVVITLLWEQMPWPVTWLASAAAYTVIGVELFYYAIGRRLRGAWEGMAIIGSPEMKRWHQMTGTQVPTTPDKMRAWLRDVPDQPEIRWARADLQATLGELDAARESANGMLVETDADRFEQRTTLAWIDWLGGADEDLDALAAEAETVGDPSSEERADARARVALARARHLAVDGGDWKRPLQELSDSRGKVGSALLQQDLRRARYRVEPIVALFLTGVVILLSKLGS
jgi:hypothetical protein